MKYLIQFSWKNKKNISSLSTAEFVYSMENVKLLLIYFKSFNCRSLCGRCLRNNVTEILSFW